MACNGCAARRARAAKWLNIARERAASLISPKSNAGALPNGKAEDAGKQSSDSA